MSARAADDPYADVWPESGPDIVDVLAEVPPDDSAGVPDSPLPQRRRQPMFTPHRHPVSGRDRMVLARVAYDLRHLDDEVTPQLTGVPAPAPALADEPFYQAAMAARYGTGDQPAATRAVPDPVPGAVVLMAIGGPTGRASARLDGMPDRRTVNGRAVFHLGDDPEHPGEAFAIGSMSDAWLDALIAVATEERDSRRPAVETPRVPTFTPRDTSPAEAAKNAPAPGRFAGGDL